MQLCCLNASHVQVRWKAHWNNIRCHDVELSLLASKRSDNSNRLKATFVMRFVMRAHMNREVRGTAMTKHSSLSVNVCSFKT